jgi:hypothetical protein
MFSFYHKHMDVDSSNKKSPAIAGDFLLLEFMTRIAINE